MQVDYALILSAGLGTRMGAIGKLIPKVMWPIFGVPLIDLQIKYCKDLGIKKIYVNTHYLADVLENHLKNKYPEIIILHEDPLLDSGGAIHNLAMRSEINYRGNLLMVNGDQFFLFDKLWMEKALQDLNGKRAVLFGIKVNKGEKYNETKTQDGKLVEIVSSNLEKDFVTYSGLGILKLDGLKPFAGISKFFQTVTNYKEETVAMLVPDKAEYWDFGTADIYFKNIKKLAENEKAGSLINGFLKSAGILNYSNYVSKELNSVRHNIADQYSENAIVRHELIQKVD